ncbi:hypothetical protein [Streptomyces sp. NPDC059828]|uniref:hypothetical protein n=1 Tax=Streptomyces sp. NPDC059828 TaxID=3346965 RepID=UPI003660511E
MARRGEFSDPRVRGYAAGWPGTGALRGAVDVLYVRDGQRHASTTPERSMPDPLERT